MRCTYDGMDDLVIGPDFKDDPDFGFIHRYGGSWHTIAGMTLLEVDGKLVEASTRVVTPLTVADPTEM